MSKMISIPYKIMAVTLVGTAIILGGVLAFGIPANLFWPT